MARTYTNQEPRWPAILAILVVGLLYTALPGYLSVGPRWLLIVLVAVLEIPTLLAHHRHWIRAHEILGLGICRLLTVFLVWSLALLIFALPTHKEHPEDLLRSAVALWVGNVIIVAFWFWRFDAGGPYGRDETPGHTEGAFLFPQMLEPETFPGWSPRFVNHLFIALTPPPFRPPTLLSLSAGPKSLPWFNPHLPHRCHSPGRPRRQHPVRFSHDESPSTPATSRQNQVDFAKY